MQCRATVRTFIGFPTQFAQFSAQQLDRELLAAVLPSHAIGLKRQFRSCGVATTRSTPPSTDIVLIASITARTRRRVQSEFALKGLVDVVEICGR